MNEARDDIYRRRKKPPELKKLPPTDANVMIHTKRAHLQMMLWKAADKVKAPTETRDIKNYGWLITYGRSVVPIVSTRAMAPVHLLGITSCNCASLKACSRKNCSCHAAGVSCTDYCNCDSEGAQCQNPFKIEIDIESETGVNELDGEENL